MNESEKNNIEWGSRAWFNKKSSTMSDSPVGYFSHNLNGYQKFRHTLLCDQIEANFDEVIKGTVVDVGCGSGHITSYIKNL